MTELYFNNAFSKQPLAAVVEAMLPFLREQFENPLTETAGGSLARDLLSSARESIAALLHAAGDEVLFVSSGTEANNWALKGIAGARKSGHIIISAVEHFSVFQTAQYLQRQGFDLTIIPVNGRGQVDPDDIKREIRPSTILVSVQAASDEIGVIQDLNGISTLKNSCDDVIFHTDAVQFLCYEELDLRKMPFDLVSISSNALYGPPGIAAFYVRKDTRIAPLLHGGMQEGGLRPGLQSMALIAGFGKAAQIASKEKAEWKSGLACLQESLFLKLESCALLPTGDRKKRIVDNIHVCADVDGEAVLALLQEEGISAGTGSTCYQYAMKESHVLKALGLTRDQARGSLLFTLGIDHQEKDVNRVGRVLGDILNHLRSLKP